MVSQERIEAVEGAAAKQQTQRQGHQQLHHKNKEMVGKLKKRLDIFPFWGNKVEDALRSHFPMFRPIFRDKPDVSFSWETIVVILHRVQSQMIERGS